MTRFGLAAAALLILSAPASAALNNVTVQAYAPGAQGAGVGFESLAIGALPNGYSELGLTFTKSGSVDVMNTSNSNGAAPAGLPVGNKYVSVLGQGALNIDVGGPSTFTTFYWGSVDSYNTIEFLSGNTVVGSLTGSDAAPLIGNGNQISDASNRLVTIRLASGTFDTIRFASSSNSFEFDNISAGVPEPSTWAMMLIGFAGLAFASSRRRNTQFATA